MSQEGNSGYIQVITQNSHITKITVHKDEQFLKGQKARNLVYEENAGVQEESFCPNTDILDVSDRADMQISFKSDSNDTEDINGLSVPLDRHFSDKGESARAVAVLTSLQDEVATALEIEHSGVLGPKKNETFTELVKDVSRKNCDNKFISKSSDLIELNLCIDNDGTVKTNWDRHYELRDRQEYSNFLHSSVKPKELEFSKSALTNEDLTPGSTDEYHSKIKYSVGESILGESKVDKKMKYDNTTENEEEAKSTNVPSDMNEKSSLVEEVRSLEFPPTPPVGARRRFKCKFCNRSWKFRKDLNKHMKTHTGTKKFVCSICNSSFINRTLLKKHLLIHSDVKLLTCQDCQTTFHSPIDLKNHQQKHASVQIFSCTECSYTTRRQKHFTKHVLVHSASIVYCCQLCKFSSKRKYSLQRHMKTTHSAVRINECSACNYKTSAVDSFKVHVAKHLSTRTTSCIICGTVVKKRQKLIEHLVNHSSDEDLTCKECDETYTTGYEYMLHLLSHKGISSNDHTGVHQTSVLDISTSSLLNGTVDSTAGTFGFLARKNKIIMDTPTMETKLSQMSTAASRLADMTKVVTLLNEKSKVIFQLAEISTLATELAVISGNVLQSYRNTYGVTGDTGSSQPKAPSESNDATEDSSYMDDDYELLSAINEPTAKIKEELHDNMFSSAEAGMQIQVDFNGEPVSCIQNDDPFRPGSLSKFKGGKPFKCARCNLTFTDTRSLKRHLMTHDDVRPYSCEKCGQSFRRNEHLKKHMVTHSDERPFVCKECPYAAKTEHRLKIHMLCHSQTKAFACQHCTYTARTNYELNHHMKRHEPRSCSQCSFVCYSRAELKKHVFTHSSFDCNECEFSTNDKAEYTKHLKKHSLVQHLCCELCGYSCDTMKKFKYHKLRHENKTPYQCPDCDYRCSSRASFDCHRLKHAGLKPYLCSFCGAAFRKTSHLNQHLLIHKDEKSFKCTECGYSCRTKHNLKEHEMTHSGEKPFTCKYCSFSCRRNKALQLHMLKHENPLMMIPALHMPNMQFPHLQMSMIPSGP